jgi:SAM-dependent methyltransferase
MSNKKCPVCTNAAYPRLKKGIVDYWQCTNCEMVFSDELPNEGMVGGGNEVPRNVEQNHLRISRIDEMVLGMKKEEVNILDFGCGTGYLIDDLKKAGYVNTDGYDAYNEKFSRLPEKDKYHIITCVECIEHTSANYLEIDVMYRSLKKGGCVYFETSFTNIAEQENIPLDEFFYIEPSVGHSSIFSHHSLDLLMALKGFRPLQHFNRHVRLYMKIDKK